MEPETVVLSDAGSSQPKTPPWVPATLAVLFILVGGLFYAGYRSRGALEQRLAAAQQSTGSLAAKLEQTRDRLAQVKGQLEVTTEKLGLTQAELRRARELALAVRNEYKQSDQKLISQLGELRQTSEAISSDVSGAKTDIDLTRKDLESTKSQLERTIGDLGVQSGLIARNHEELEELKQRGERDIYEFNLGKTKQPYRLGPIQIQLRKSDAKKYRYTLYVFADDKRIEKKDKTLGEPVQFYVHGVRVPCEIVVYEVAKDRVTGYLSAPKDVAYH